MMTPVRTVLVRLQSKVRAVVVRALSAARPPAQASDADARQDDSAVSMAPVSERPTPASETAGPQRRVLSPAAQRALAEAAVRRAEADRLAAEAAKLRPKEFQGPKGPEPTRYGDWENKGIASDF
jgi:hypothetical protein